MRNFRADIFAKELDKQKADKRIDFAFKASRWYLRGATGLDMSTTYIGLDRSHGVETGWAKCFGNRNTSAVIAANAGLNAGIDWLDRRLYQRGGRWRILATSLNVLKGTGNALDGVNNIRYIARH
ncbi:MAG TPA: hypothetical protein VMT99_02325 [Candidatus Paceibacterota bacterium]|nr:hypothetical protein [Candidatus Paceibacterota bacterium]